MKKAALIPCVLLLSLLVFTQSNIDSHRGVWANQTAPDSTRAPALKNFT